MLQRLYSGDNVSVGDYRCRSGRGMTSSEEQGRWHEIAFVRRGVFTLRLGNQEALLSPTHALLLEPGDHYRIAHPVEDGDECTVFTFAEEGVPVAALKGVEAAKFRGWHRAPCSARSFLRHQRLFSRLTCDGPPDGLEVEEEAWIILSEFIADAEVDAGVRASTRVRVSVHRAQELLATHFHESLPLETVASAVGLSAFHLSRHFRRLTGTTMHQSQNSLRLRAALYRLNQGENDLTALALDLGFSHHSHFCVAFRRSFGITPSHFRLLGERDRGDLLRGSRSPNDKTRRVSRERI